jgi:hypothetical protein
MRAIYVGVAALIALVAWVVVRSGNPAKPEGKKIRQGPPTRQQELFEARNRIRRQIEVLQTSPHAYGAPSRDALVELQSLQREIDDELKMFGPH